MSASQNNKRYYAIPEKLYLYDEKKISEGAKLLYPALCMLSKKFGYCYATNRYLGNLRGKSIASISRFISQLENEGFIRSTQVQSLNQRRIYITPIDKVVPISTKDKEAASRQGFENLAVSLRYKMHDNFKQAAHYCEAEGIVSEDMHQPQQTPVHKTDNTGLIKTDNTPNQICVDPLVKSDEHIINTDSKKLIKKPSKEDFYNWVRSIEVSGVQIHFNVNVFLTQMNNRNWQIDEFDDVKNWMDLFLKINDMYKTNEKEKQSILT